MVSKSLKIACGVWILAALALVGPSRASALSTETNQPIMANTFVHVSKQVLPSVVSIEVERDLSEMHGQMRGRTPQDLEDLLRRFFGDQIPEGMQPMPGPDNNDNNDNNNDDYTYKTAGSGFFFAVDGSTGYVMTNNHVIDDAKNGDISIILDTSYNDKKISGDKVTIVGRDTLGDLAVLKVDIGDLKIKPIEWGDSEKLDIGEWVVALGNPLELRNSVTQGIVSAEHRKITGSGIEDLLQTTASINPGNSGGPLVNLDGKIVGINNAIATRTGMWQGVSFAIPSSYAKKIAEQLQENGKVTWGYLGIQMTDLTDQMAKYFDLKNDHGIIVQSVNAGTAADKAGLKPYDIITKVDGQAVSDTSDMLRLIATKEVGAKVDLTVLRKPDNSDKLETLELTAVLGQRPSEEELTTMMGGPALQRNLSDKYGFTFDTQNPSTEGLKIKSVEPGSLAAKAGLRAGDVILQVNRVDVKTTDDLATALKKRPDGKDHLIMFTRGGLNSFTTMAPASK